MHIEDVQPTHILTARPNALAKSFWGWYFRRFLRRSFHSVYVAGEGAVARWRGDAHATLAEPLILYCTHFSWWDAIVTIVLSLQRYQFDAIGMMEYRQLNRHRFFRNIGMFSVVREDYRSAMTSLQYAADQLRGRPRVLWMFPQGTLVHPDVDIHCEVGLATIARNLGTVWLCPVALRYELVHEQYPVALVRFGKAERLVWTPEADVRDITIAADQRLTYLADRIRRDAMQNDVSAYTNVIRGRTSVEKRRP